MIKVCLFSSLFPGQAGVLEYARQVNFSLSLVDEFTAILLP